MTPATQPSRARLRVLLLAALAALAALLFGAGTASASSLPAAQTRVGAITPAVSHAVGVHECITAGQHWVRGPSQLRLVVGHCVAAEDGAGAAFRSDTAHIFRNATGHFAEDTAENRALIQGAISPGNLRSTIRLPDESTLEKYFQDLPDGRQAWVEVRNGTEITNGGVNATPR